MCVVWMCVRLVCIFGRHDLFNYIITYKYNIIENTIDAVGTKHTSYDMVFSLFYFDIDDITY